MKISKIETRLVTTFYGYRMHRTVAQQSQDFQAFRDYFIDQILNCSCSGNSIKLPCDRKMSISYLSKLILENIF